METNPRKKKNNERQKGFTMLEILVVSAIIATLSSIMIINWRGSENKYNLERSVYKLSQDLRRASNLATSSQEFGGVWPGGYGLYFNIAESNHYILFTDDGDGTYESGVDGLVENILLESGVAIESLSSQPILTIIFVPPDPVVNIIPSAQTAEISLAGGKSVFINAAGMIEIQ